MVSKKVRIQSYRNTAGFGEFMKFRDEFADVNRCPLGNLKQGRLHTNKQTNRYKQVNCSFCKQVNCSFCKHTNKQTTKQTFLHISKSKYVKMGGLRRRQWVTQREPHERVQLLLVLLHVCTILYKTTCIYDYHIY